MKKFIYLIVISLSIFCISCNQLNNELSDDDEKKVSVEEMTKKYVQNKNVWTNFETGRNATSVEETVYPDFLFHLELYDENGKPIKFEDFSEEQKQQFYLAWQQEEINHCIEVLEDNEELQQEVLLDNLAMEEAIKTGVIIKSCGLAKIA